MVEQKYVLIGQGKQMILDWLEHTCVRDPNYYFGTISSIYFDTPSLDLYNEKRNSDYIKTKVRLRWYADLDQLDADQPVDCYLEMKRKYGSHRVKERIKLAFETRKLRDAPFSDPKILDLSMTARGLASAVPADLVPTLLIQYNRYRFVDPQTGSRIALDADIRCTKTNLSYVAGTPPVFLGQGVLEVKGGGRVLPVSLHPVSTHFRKDAFSKYGFCLESLMQPFGRRL